MAPFYRWVVWNLFLAFLPVLLAGPVAKLLRSEGAARYLARLLGGLGLLVWLLVLPNSVYLLTEWRHWFDWLTWWDWWPRWQQQHDLAAFRLLVTRTVFMAAFSLAGVLAWWLAVRPMLALVGARWRPWAMAALCWLNAMGVYLGLELRFNSWDVLHRPLHIVQEALAAAAHPIFVVLTIAFALLIWVCYEVVETLWVGWQERRRQAGARGQRAATEPRRAGNARRVAN